jgi:predicted dehydrogenase
MPDDGSGLHARPVGCGMVCPHPLRARANADVPGVAVCDIDHARAEARAAELGISRVHACFDDAVADKPFETARLDHLETLCSIKAVFTAAGAEVR